MLYGRTGVQQRGEHGGRTDRVRLRAHRGPVQQAPPLLVDRGGVGSGVQGGPYGREITVVRGL